MLDLSDPDVVFALALLVAATFGAGICVATIPGVVRQWIAAYRRRDSASFAPEVFVSYGSPRRPVPTFNRPSLEVVDGPRNYTGPADGILPVDGSDIVTPPPPPERRPTLEVCP